MFWLTAGRACSLYKQGYQAAGIAAKATSLTSRLGDRGSQRTKIAN
jgi:hypothetical protein